MKNYELLYIVSGNFTELEVPKVAEKIELLIKKLGGEIGYKKSMGKKKLAYPIKKSLHGYYEVVEFELPDGSKLETITNDLRLDKEILRSQLIAKPKITAQEIERQEKREKMGDLELTADKKEPVVEKKTPDKKIKMKDLDEKLDEILKDNII